MQIHGKSFALGVGVTLFFNMCSSNAAQNLFNVTADGISNVTSRKIDEAMHSTAKKPATPAPSASASSSVQDKAPAKK